MMVSPPVLLGRLRLRRQPSQSSAEKDLELRHDRKQEYFKDWEGGGKHTCIPGVVCPRWREETLGLTPPCSTGPCLDYGPP